MNEDIIERTARVMYEGFAAAASERVSTRYQPWNWTSEGIKDNNRIRARALADAGLLSMGTALDHIEDMHQERDTLRTELRDHVKAPERALKRSWDLEARIEKALALIGNGEWCSAELHGLLRAALTGESEGK